MAPFPLPRKAASVGEPTPETNEVKEDKYGLMFTDQMKDNK